MIVFYLTLCVSLLLMVGGFLTPPMGIIDGSVLTAVGLLFGFAALAQVPDVIRAVRDGKSFSFTKGDIKLGVFSKTASDSDTGQD